jgi:hypothetical protein
MENLQYPIGRFLLKTVYTPASLEKLLTTMEAAPARYKPLASLQEADQNKTYRQGSWTVRQLIHHVADIHLLNFLRIKKLLTEEENVATIINMDAWAATPDSTSAPVADSLLMLEGINNRFLYLLNRLQAPDFERTYYHPVRKLHFTLPAALHMAVWHLEHHQAHIQLALGKEVHAFTLD